MLNTVNSSQSGLAPVDSKGSLRFSLRFLVGPAEGRELHLRANETITIGRSVDADLVLFEELVSRNQARLIGGATLRLEDLGSKNGTLVNGKRIKNVVLREGDTVMFGSSAAVVEVTAVVPMQTLESSDGDEEDKEDDSAFISQFSSMNAATMTGLIEELSLAELLQLFAISKKSCLISVANGTQVGSIFVRDGVVESALINDKGENAPLKNFIRLMAWTKGSFSVHPLGDWSFAKKLDMGISSLLMEAMRQQDELAVILGKLAPEVILEEGPGDLLPASLSPQLMESLALARTHRKVQACLDASDDTDLDTANCLHVLLKKGYLRTI